jgi:general secretion pathway protein G
MNRRQIGFTLIELLVTLALVGIAASVALPLASVVETRAKETELRRSLRTIRTALDSYKAAADAGAIAKSTGSSGYPSNLEVLVLGVPRSTAFGMSSLPMVFLRKIPRDPFNEDKSIPDAQTWYVRSYGSAPNAFKQAGTTSDVFDVASKSQGVGLDGTSYRDW